METITMEGFNSSINSEHTLRQRLVLTIFKETLLKMLQYKSEMYVREKEQKVFHTDIVVHRDDWAKAVLYAKHPDTKRKVFINNEVYYILSDDELNREEQRVTNGQTAAVLFYSCDASSFEEYSLEYHQRVYELKLKDNFMDPTCSCPYYMKNPTCKHILAISMLKRIVQCPVEANPDVLAKKPKRGRKSNAKGALQRD